MRRAAVVLVLVGASVLGTAGGTSGSARPWKGAETMNPVSIGPNLARCGDAPANLEARFVGTGMDVLGGPFAVTASGCLNTETFELFDLEATDTFLNGSGSIEITPHDATLVLDPESCVATNVEPVPFGTGAGTGSYEGATGSGTFDIAFVWPPCGGAPGPAYVWFEGELQPAG